MRKIFLTSLLALSLTGCSAMSSQFETDGMYMSSVNRQVATGQMQAAQTWSDKKVRPVWNFAPKNELRVAERVMRVWLAPYKDMAGNWHASHRIFQVVEHGRWSPNTNGG